MPRTKRVKIFLQGEIIFMEMVRGSRRNIPSGVIFLSNVSLNGNIFFPLSRRSRRNNEFVYSYSTIFEHDVSSLNVEVTGN